jgi:diguanylate cyclase (GGDEF)-like protein
MNARLEVVRNSFSQAFHRVFSRRSKRERNAKLEVVRNSFSQAFHRIFSRRGIRELNTRLRAVLNLFPQAFHRIFSRRRKRVLIHEILSIQILSAATFGALAVASLYWGSQWVLQENYSRWALQWTEELNELGAPLYLTDDGDALIRLEGYIAKYPEISQVTYFGNDGVTLFSIRNQEDAPSVVSLPAHLLQSAKNLVGSDKPYLIQNGIIDPRQFEIFAPVWTESITDDGLFAFDSADATNDSQTKLVGVVGMHLDFIIFHDSLLSNIKVAIGILLALLVILAFFGRRALRSALSSLSDLERPIQELAKGNLSVKFKPAEHREISDIVEALESTVSALGERNATLLKLANHDNLTGLFNRRRFVEDLKSELENSDGTDGVLALLFIDLDQFKYINDTCGHPAGDRLICTVAEELTRAISSNDTVARFGGDEFVVLLRNTNEISVRSVTDKILQNMRGIAHTESEQVFRINCSIGVTIVSKSSPRNHDDLIAQADIACREAKLAGRNRMHFYTMSDQQAQRASSDAGWMNKLRDALDENLFELRFQPINSIDNGRSTHHEVLLRLRTADGSLASPDAFLPAAVRFGLMSEIDLWVIRNVAKAYVEFSEAYVGDLKLSVNLSANAFENENLDSLVKDTFKEFGVPPSHIIFEVTESLAIRRPAHVERQITALRSMGCELALDDFGTGYSSFSYLQKLHFDYIKIDGTFVQNILENPVDQKMIKLIAEVGKEAGMKTIAEYVQNAESLALLEQLGVDLAQGYFVGRPTKQPTQKPTPVSLEPRRERLLRMKKYSS